MTLQQIFISRFLDFIRKIPIINRFIFSIRRRFFDILQKWILHRGKYILSIKEFFKNQLDQISYKIIFPSMHISYTEKELDFFSKIDWTIFAGRRETKFKEFPEVFSCVLNNIKFFGISGGIGIKDQVLAESVRGKGGLPEILYGDHVLLPHNKKKGLYTSIMLLDWSRSNIYHWLIDCVPRLMAITQIGNTKIKFIINKDIVPYQREILNFFLDDRFELVPIRSYEVWELERYLFSSFVPSGTGYIPPLFLKFVREKILHSYKIATQNPKIRIYVSRFKAKKGRKVLNEKEILKIFDKFNFQRVFAEDLTFKEQVELFRSAEIIVSPHGQGLTNMIFSEQAKILELLPPLANGPKKILSPMIFMLAKSMGFEYQYLIGNRLFEKENFELDPIKLEKLLEQMCK